MNRFRNKFKNVDFVPKKDPFTAVGQNKNLPYKS